MTTTYDIETFEASVEEAIQRQDLKAWDTAVFVRSGYVEIAAQYWYCHPGETAGPLWDFVEGGLIKGGWGGANQCGGCGTPGGGWHESGAAEIIDADTVRDLRSGKTSNTQSWVEAFARDYEEVRSAKSTEVKAQLDEDARAAAEQFAADIAEDPLALERALAEYQNSLASTEPNVCADLQNDTLVFTAWNAEPGSESDTLVSEPFEVSVPAGVVK